MSEFKMGQLLKVKEHFGVVTRVFSDGKGASCQSVSYPGYCGMPVFDFMVANGEVEFNPEVMTFEQVLDIVGEPVTDEYGRMDSWAILKVHDYEGKSQCWCGGDVQYHLTVALKGHENFPNTYSVIRGMYISRDDDGKLKIAIPA